VDPSGAKRTVEGAVTESASSSAVRSLPTEVSDKPHIDPDAPIVLWGRVTDSNGEPLPKAVRESPEGVLDISDGKDRGFLLTSGQAGAYAQTRIPPGTWRAIVHVREYMPAVEEIVLSASDQRVRRDFQLEAWPRLSVQVLVADDAVRFLAAERHVERVN